MTPRGEARRPDARRCGPAILLVVALGLWLPSPGLAQVSPDSASAEPPREATQTPVPARQADVWTDAWGQPKNFGLGALEAWMGNFLPWVFNELVPGRAELKISQVSPRSWWRNIEEGWKWDDNAFQVNLFAHPFQGNIYYNGARSNGYGYWTSLLFATAGSFHWECCGETHFMSINDWINTSIGGAAVGEMLYRASSRVLDNEATGADRFFREAAAFAMNPNRGFTRLITGNARRVYANPQDPNDRHPEEAGSVFSLGLRGSTSVRNARGGELRESLATHGFLDVELTSGSLATLDRGKPFDFFTMSAQVNFIRGRGLGGLAILGHLWHTTLTENEKTVAKLVVTQNFEYSNNSSFEHGGQGAGFMYYRRSRLSERSTLAWSASATWMILGGIKSELAFLADVEGIRERFREYDFGTGPGLRGGITWAWEGRRVLEGSYRAQYMKTLNGSSGDGFGSDHFVQILRTRAVIPFELAGFGLGVDYEHYRRRSDFDADDLGLVKQHNDLWQAFVRWTPKRPGA